MEKRMLKPNDLCKENINSAISKANLSSKQMLILGILAGAFIAIGGFSSAIVSHNVTNFSISKLLAGMIFPVGLMLVIICGAELFTGNSLMVTAVLEKRITFKEMMKNWILVYIANFVGSLLIVLLIYYSGSLDVNSGKLGSFAIKTAYTKSILSSSKAFFSGILCNFIVCLTVWGSFAAKDIISKISIIWFPIMAFVISGFEHSVANMYFLFIGLLAKNNPNYLTNLSLNINQLSNINMLNISHNLLWVTLGNIVGGSVLVATLYWSVYRKNLCNEKIVNLNSNIETK
ncbi:formate/nitrite transporter family protein [Clostridium rectalis]|uniref:formate/nitrite transporter family protein n=1 Tax=Clostridium rectalis TaxID=2040295 RepID=UPI000F639092|nr:formate/nitrite transporter family protein [Clostridium rectalis]